MKLLTSLLIFTAFNMAAFAQDSEPLPSPRLTWSCYPPTIASASRCEAQATAAYEGAGCVFVEASCAPGTLPPLPDRRRRADRSAYFDCGITSSNCVAGSSNDRSEITCSEGYNRLTMKAFPTSSWGPTTRFLCIQVNTKRDDSYPTTPGGPKAGAAH